MKTTQARFVKPFLAISAVAILACGSVVKADDAMKVSGFVDAGYTWKSGRTNGVKNNTFGVNDGAVYVTKSLDKGMVLLDLPFMWGSATSADFSFATTKAQAYVGYNYDFGFSWRLGQFDTITGVEQNDLWDVVFTRHGIVYDLLPVVHTGLLMGYTMDPVSIHALVTNPKDKGQMNGNIPDFGAKLAFASQMFRMHFVWLQNQNTGGTSSKTYYDIVFGLTYEKFNADLEGAFAKPATGDTTSGYSLAMTYGFTDVVSAGLRGEMTKKTVSDTVVEVTAGPQFAMTKDMTVKFDYTLTSTKATSGADSKTGHGMGLAALHRF